MSKYIASVVLIVLTFFFGGCAQSPTDTVAPQASLSQHSVSEFNSGIPNLWGYYTIYIDTDTDDVVVVPDRTSMFTANIVSVLNGNPASLQSDLNGKTTGAGFVEIDMDISITHPFPGQTQFNGYDVRGVFIGNGSDTMLYQSPQLKVASLGPDQYMLDDPSPGAGDPAGGGPDGYTRWFNPAEFTTQGLFGYTPGLVATNGYTGTATVNPYKYFADNLGPNGDAMEFLDSTSGDGIFSAGNSNTRNYYIRFPVPTPGPKFNYAVLATWKGTAPADHPANAFEALSATAVVTDDIFFNSPADFGGNIIADITVFDWLSTLTGGVMQNYTIKIESTVLNTVYTASTADMTPTASGPHNFTYHFSIPAEQVNSLDGNEFWAIVEYSTHDYQSNSAVPNLVGADPLAAFFRFDLPVHPGVQNYDVSMIDFSFIPKDITVPAGQTVTWTNNEGFPHTVTSDPLNPVAGGPNSDVQFPSGMSQGQTYDWVVPSAPSGTKFFYHCRFHGVAGNGSTFGSGMTGSVTVQ